MKRLATSPHRTLRHGLYGILLLLPVCAGAAMEQLTEGELAYVNGQGGLEAQILSSGVYLAGMRVDADSTTLITDLASLCTGTQCGTLWSQDLQISPASGGVGSGYLMMDVGAVSNSAIPKFSYLLHLDPVRIAGSAPNTGYTMTSHPGRDIGQLAMVMPLDFAVAGYQFYGNPSSDAYVKLQIDDGKLFYRQLGPGHANLAVDHINFRWESSPTSLVDFTTEGLRLSDTVGYLGVAFDAFYKFHADQDMATITANDRPGLSFSWGGNIYNSMLFARAGGIWNTAVTQATNVAIDASGLVTNNLPTLAEGKTAGINFGLRWNYKDASGIPDPVNDFLWSIGHPQGDREQLRFGDWRNLEQATGPVPNRYGYDIPLLVIDSLANSTSAYAGGSLCWGGQMSGAACSGGGNLLQLRAGTIEGYPSPLSGTGLPLTMSLIRNGNLLAWSNQATMMANGVQDYAAQDWGLAYTLPNINSNIYIYAGGNEDDTSNNSRQHGLIMDVLLMSQSFGNWQSNYTTASGGTCNATTGAGCVNTTRWSQGAHFMIADTNAQMGIGFLGSSILLAIDDMRFWVRDTTAGQVYPNNLLGGIDLVSPRTRINFTGLFGGALLPRGLNLVRGAYIDLNAEGLISTRLSPAPTNLENVNKTAESQDVIVFSMMGRFRCGALNSTNFGCNTASVGGSNIFADSAGSNIASGRGSYLSIAEPGDPSIDLRMADFSGDFAITEGSMQLHASNDTNNDVARGMPDRAVSGKPELAISQKILIGASAASNLNHATVGIGMGTGGAAGRPLTTNLTYGGNHIGSIAIPAGSIYSAISIYPQ